MTLNNITIVEQPLGRRRDDLLKKDSLLQFLANLNENLFALCQQLKQRLGLTHRARHSVSGRKSLGTRLSPFSQKGFLWRLLHPQLPHDSTAGAQNKILRRAPRYLALDCTAVT